jgi:uncharacterized repeat protein (TIGR01451 family)
VSQRGQRDTGQALVEFSLSLIVLLLLIFALIEGGRLLHGWITLQGAVREGSRYAITGKYDQDCLAATPVCPDARVFAIKKRVLEAATGLAVDSRAGYESPKYLRVEVSGINKDDAWQAEYSGEPGRPVMVRAIYRMPVVTPLLRPIAESIKLSSQLVVNNENYAQVSRNRSDAELTDLPPPPPPTIPVADLQIRSDVSPLVTLINETIAYSLQVSNHGPDEAKGVVVVDELPSGVTLLSVTPEGICQQIGNVLTCDVPNLPRGVSYDISINVSAPSEPPPAPGDVVNRARVTGSERDDDLSNNEDDCRTVVVLSETVVDLEVVSKDDLPDPVVINQLLTYTILVRNNGIADATDVELTDHLPEGLVYESSSVSNGGSCTESAGAIICDLGGIVDGDTVSVDISAWAPASPGTIINIATVAGAQVDPDERNNENSELTTIAPEWSDLYISTVDSPDPALVGTEINYLIRAGNNGPSDASGVTIIDTLPAEASFVSATPSQGECSASAQTITCDLAVLQSSQDATVDVVIISEVVGTLTNQATISSDQVDPNPVNDRDTTVTTVEPMADLSISISADPTTPPGVRAGELLTYRLLIANDGPSPATNMIVADQLPIDLSFLDVTTTQGVCEYEGRVVDCNLGNLANGETIEITIQGIPEQEGILVNSATVSGSQADVDRADNTAEDTTTVLEATNAFITLDPVCGDPGSTVTVRGFKWPSEGNKDVKIYWDSVDVRSQIGVVNDNGVAWSVEQDIPVSAIEGPHTVHAIRQNTTAEAIYSVPCPAPNLTVTQPELVTPGAVQVGDLVTFQAEITNDGDLDVVNQFFVGLYFDPPVTRGSEITHIPQNYRSEIVAISWLPVGDSRLVSITAENGFYEPGQHDVYIVVDSDPGPEGNIGELREYDNVSPVLQVEVDPSPMATPTPGPLPNSTPPSNEPGSLIGQAFLSPAGGQPLPQAGVEVLVYDAETGLLSGVTFSDSDGSYFLSEMSAGLKTIASCIIIDSVSYAYTTTGIEIVSGQITFKDLFMDEGPCN